MGGLQPEVGALLEMLAGRELAAPGGVVSTGAVVAANVEPAVAAPRFSCSLLGDSDHICTVADMSSVIRVGWGEVPFGHRADAFEVARVEAAGALRVAVVACES